MRQDLQGVGISLQGQWWRFYTSKAGDAGSIPGQGTKILRAVQYSQKIKPVRCWESENEVAQSCLTLCNPMDYSLPGFSVHGIFQARIPKWVAISSSRVSSQPRDRTPVSCIAGRSLPSTPICTLKKYEMKTKPNSSLLQKSKTTLYTIMRIVK